MKSPTRSQSETLGYGRQNIGQDDIDAVVEVLRSDFLTQGPALESFEKGLADVCGVDHVVAVSSGTAALHLAYKALGVGPGTDVWVPANTFLATATAAIHCGGDVDVLDVEKATGNLDLDLLERRLEREEHTPDVITVVHFAGLPCDMQRLIALKRRYGFRIVEDAAHALGARYCIDDRWWAPGSHPEIDVACLSFHPVKSITCGEGGAVLLSDSQTAARTRRLRSHGIAGDYAPSVPFSPMIELGFNYRLSDLHAALGKSQLGKLAAFVDRRREIAQLYRELLDGFELPAGSDAARQHAWHLFVIKVDEHERAPLVDHLRDHGIRTQLHYVPLTWHPWFRTYLQARVPVAENHARRAISLPIHPGLTDDDVRRVAEELQEWRRR